MKEKKLLLVEFVITAIVLFFMAAAIAPKASLANTENDTVPRASVLE